MTAERGDGQVTLRWAAAARGGAATAWQYRYRADGGYSGWMTVPGGGSPRSFVVTGLANGTDHTFLVRGTNAAGDGPESAPVRARPIGSSAEDYEPRYWGVRPGDGEVLVFWEITRAEVDLLRSVPWTGMQYRAREAGGSWSFWEQIDFNNPYRRVGDTSVYRVAVTGLRNGTEHEFQVRAPSAHYEAPPIFESEVRAATPLSATGQTMTLTATARDGEVMLSWPRDWRASRFEYQMRAGGAGWGLWMPASVSRLRPVLVVGGLANGTQYGFRVRAVKAQIAVSAEATATPSAPVNVLARPVLAAEAGDSQVALSWPADSAATGWEVQRTAEGGRVGRWLPVGVAYPSTATGVTVGGLANDTQYTFRVRATGAGSVKGAASDPVRATPAAPATVPAKPTGLTLAPAGVGAARLDWSGKGHEVVVAEWQYRYKTTGEYGDWATASRRGDAGDPTQHTVEGLDITTDHVFSVRGLNAFGTPGPPSDEATIKAAPAATALPAVGGQVALSWEAVPGAVSYEYRSRSRNESWAGQRSWNSAGTGTSHTFTHAGDPLPIVQMRAKFPGGAAGLLTAELAVLGKPADLTLEPGTDTVRLRWSDVRDVAQWQYRRKVGTDPVQGWVTLDGAGTAHTVRIQQVEGHPTPTDRDHTFQVRGLDAHGAVGPASDWAKMKAAPQTVRAQRTDTQVTLSWTAAPSAIPGAVSYEYRAKPSGDPWSAENHPWTSAGTGTTHTFNQANDSTLVVQMRAVTPGAAGLLSSELRLLRKPTGLALEPDIYTVGLRWSGDGDVARWQYRRKVGTGPVQGWVTLDGAGTAHTARIDDTKRDHTFQVRGLDANGTPGPASDWAKMKAAPQIPSAQRRAGEVTLNWAASGTAIPGAVSYEYRVKPGDESWSDEDHPWTSAGTGTSHTFAYADPTADHVFQMRAAIAGATGLHTRETMLGTMTEQVQKLVQDEIIDGEWGANHPWLRAVAVVFKPMTRAETHTTWGHMWVCSLPDRSCASGVGINPWSSRWLGVYVFEYARVYAVDSRPTGGPQASVGMGWMYLQHVLAEAKEAARRANVPCNTTAFNMFADTLMNSVTGELSGYWSLCSTLPRAWDADVQANMRSVVAGQTPAWFAEQFQNDDLTWRLEDIWASLKALEEYRYTAIYHFKNSYGGFCSADRYLEWTSADSTVTNPWVDGGCAPTAPTDTSLVAGAEKLTLSWGAPASAGGAPVSYRVQWKESSQAGWDTGVSSAEVPAGAASYVLTGLTAGQEYKVRVIAENEIGVGDPSAVHTGTPSAGSGAPVLVPSVSVTHNGTALSVAWNGSARATSYDVEYRDSDAATWTSAATDHTATSLTISGTDPSKTYTARVEAKNNHGSSGWRASLPASPRTPDPVGSISVTHNGDSLTVTWDASARATSYDVTYHGNGVDARAAWNRAGTSLTITCDIRPENQNQNCVNGEHAYTVNIRARNPGGESTWVRSGIARPVDPVGSISVTHNGDSLTVTWDAPDGAATYDVTYQGNGTDARAAWNRAGTSLTITCDIRPENQNQNCVSGEHAYTVSIRARNAVGGTSEWATSAAASPAQPPAVPGGFGAEAGDGEVTLSWSAVAGATGYEYQYKTSGDFGAAWSDAGTATSKVVTGLANGTEHTFRVRAVKGSGQSKLAGTPTAPQSATPQAAVPDAPDAVASVAVVHNGATLSVSWDAPARAADYDVEYRAAGAQSWTSAATDHTATTLTISSGVDAAGSYTVRVRANNAGGASAWTTSPAAAPAPDAVASVVVVHLGFQLVVGWEPPARATAYDVEYRTSDSETWISAAQDYTIGTLTIGGIDATKTYIVRVKAKNNGRESAWTNSDPAAP